MSNNGPTSKEKKYDRQLRLWGANGQAALEDAHICLVNATATGAETLKNLVLPGIGRFTIVDDATVTEADLGSNFFLDESSIGQPRAECCSNLLGELNPDVKGGYIVGSLSSLLTSDPTFITTTHVSHILLLSPIPTQLLLSLQSNHPTLPIFHVYSLGFVSSLRILLPELTIVETHPDSLVDLRLANPWPELSELAAEHTKDITSMSKHRHGHIPYVSLLLHYLTEWKLANGGKLPLARSERRKFAEKVTEEMRTDVPGGGEENYEEAVAAITMHVKAHDISSTTREVLADPSANDLSPGSPSFWIIAKAANMFVQNPKQGNGLLPLSGGLPDMKAESRDYVDLQNIYRAKARSDIAMVRANVDELMAGLGRESSEIPNEEVEVWCRHSNYIRCVRWRPMADDMDPDGHQAHMIYSELNHNPESLAPLYIALRAYQTYLDEQYESRERTASSQDPPTLSKLSSPGEEEGRIGSDITALMNTVVIYLKSVHSKVEGELYEQNTSAWINQVSSNIRKWVEEIVRCGGGEVHNIASLTGGLVAQEIIKVITRQYIPANNTVLFDGVMSRTQVLEV